MRRGLALIAAAAMLAMPAIGLRAAADPESQRRLELTNLHGGEKLTVTFNNEHDMAPDALRALRHLLVTIGSTKSTTSTSGCISS